jgi:predicted helicase
MSLDAIRNYYREVESLKHRGGTGNESVRRFAFQKLLDTYARSKELQLVAEVGIKGRKGKVVYPDGTLKDILRQDWGYWECKDEYDDLEQEISKKFDLGYPNDNILFEDGVRALLYQDGNEVSRTDFQDEASLDKVLKNFLDYQRPEIAEFRKAIELFKRDVPKVTEALRNIIVTKAEQNTEYLTKMKTLLTLCKEVINPNITKDDIREMVIQHILTADIFNTIFDEPNFHRENNIARELNNLTDTFFTREVRNNTLAGIKHYYDTINAKAAQIYDHHEKQLFLKVVYETFYKSYDPKKADRLGVVYTPNEIVRFMIDSTDYLLGKHFNKQLEDKNVEILDPATGTGTFICELIDHFRPENLEYKYKNELHANEVEILPYYIANLNIEFTYKQKMGQYAEFANLCFVDTLDNMGFDYKDKQDDIFSLSDENAERIKKQNEKKISVIIGNPPYNANQMNENENNKNREYPEIDDRIKKTYIKYSTAQKTKVYDMYARFYRWAMDRLDDNGIIAFITNRSFIDSRTFDGFRRIIQDNFDYAYIIDTKSDVRQNPKIAGTTHNVFGIQTGVAMMFLVRLGSTDEASVATTKQHKKPVATFAPNVEVKHCNIKYIALEDTWRKEDKLHWLSEHKLDKIPFEHIQPDKDNYWIKQTNNDWDELTPVADKQVKNNKSNKALFRNYSLGLNTARDEWVYDESRDNLSQKVNYLINTYNKDVDSYKGSKTIQAVKSRVDYSIKWTRAIMNDLMKARYYSFDGSNVKTCIYRPFFKRLVYFSQDLNEMPSYTPMMFPHDNTQISFNISNSKDFYSIVSDSIPDYHFTGDTCCLSMDWYDKDGKCHDNITDWALAEFQKQYNDKNISKEDIFHYVYGVLHNPAYRTKYEQNLKRSLPRIPYYEDFGQWAAWGKALMELHLNFETVAPYPLEREEFILIDDSELYDHSVVPAQAGTHAVLKEKSPRLPSQSLDPRLREDDEARIGSPSGEERQIKAKLKADKENGRIILDSMTTLSGIPAEAWAYKLGNRSALEWILDQYKEKKPKDPTIAKLFNTYRFADYKDKVIDLLLRVTTVSVETMQIVREMEKIKV